MQLFASLVFPYLNSLFLSFYFLPLCRFCQYIAKTHVYFVIHFTKTITLERWGMPQNWHFITKDFFCRIQMCIQGKFNNLSTQICKQLNIRFWAKIYKIQTYVKLYAMYEIKTMTHAFVYVVWLLHEIKLVSTSASCFYSWHLTWKKKNDTLLHEGRHFRTRSSKHLICHF